MVAKNTMVLFNQHDVIVSLEMCCKQGDKGNYTNGPCPAKHYHMLRSLPER